MKKAIPYLAIIALLISIGSCKKSDNNNNNNENGYTFTPVYIAPSQPGILQVSQSSITINVGQSATVSAAVYNSDGTAQTNQPTFFWDTDSSNVATVSNGQVTGVAEGSAIISVTDGSHGIMYVGVNVVSPSTTIPSSPTDIVFTPPVLVLAKQQSGSISYSIRNQSGQTTAASPTFIASSGITVTGNTVQAGNTAGNYTVMAISGTDTLRGALQVIVYDPQSTSHDTVVKIFNLINFPINFTKNNLVSNPFRIGVVKTYMNSNGTLSVEQFQTSPTDVTIYNTNVVTINAAGNFTSVGPGTSRVSFRYESESVNYAYIYVAFDLEGKWSGGDYQICSGGNNAHIFYTGFDFTQGNTRQDNVVYQTCSSTAYCRLNAADGFEQVVASGYPSPISGGFEFGYWGNASDLGKSKQPNTYATTLFNFPGPCNTAGQVRGLYVDDNHITISGTTLTRGTGTCSTGGGGGGGGTLEDALLGKTTWVGNSCWLANACGNNFKFNSNHTFSCSIQDSICADGLGVALNSTSATGNWQVDTTGGSATIFMWVGNTPPSDPNFAGWGFPVASFTSSTITIADPAHEFTCTMLWNGQ